MFINLQFCSTSRVADGAVVFTGDENECMHKNEHVAGGAIATVGNVQPQSSHGKIATNV